MEEKMKRKTYNGATAAEIRNDIRQVHDVQNRGLGDSDQCLRLSIFKLPAKNFDTSMISNTLHRLESIDVAGKSSILNSSLPSGGKLSFDSMKNPCSTPFSFGLIGNRSGEKELCETFTMKVIPKYSCNSTIPADYGNKSSNASVEDDGFKKFPHIITTQREMLMKTKFHTQKVMGDRYKGKKEALIFPNVQGQSTKPIKSILVEADDQRKHDYDLCGWFPICPPHPPRGQRQSGNQCIVNKTNRKVWFDPHGVESRGVCCTLRHRSHSGEYKQRNVKHFPSLELAYTDLCKAEITSLDLETLHSGELRPRLISLPVSCNAEIKQTRPPPKLPKLSLFKRTADRAATAGDRRHHVQNDGLSTLDKICIDKCKNSDKKKILLQKQPGPSAQEYSVLLQTAAPDQRTPETNSEVTSDTLGNCNINCPVPRRKLAEIVNPINASPVRLPVLSGSPRSAPPNSSIRSEGTAAVPPKALGAAHVTDNTAVRAEKAGIYEKLPDVKTKQSLTANLRQVIHVLSNTHYPRQTNLPVSSFGIKSMYHIYGRMFTGLAKKEYRKRFNLTLKSNTTSKAHRKVHFVPQNTSAENELTNDVLKNVRRIERELKRFT